MIVIIVCINVATLINYGVVTGTECETRLDDRTLIICLK